MGGLGLMEKGYCEMWSNTYDYLILNVNNGLCTLKKKEEFNMKGIIQLSFSEPAEFPL